MSSPSIYLSSSAVARLLRLVAVGVLGLMSLWVTVQLGDLHLRITDQTRLGGSFSVYRGYVYVSGSGDGFYQLPDADASSFEEIVQIEEASYGYPLGRDHRAVYCGDRVIAGLNPRSVRVIAGAGGYVTDGVTIWFCSRAEERPDYHWWQELFASKNDIDPERMKRYGYPVVALDEARVATLHGVTGEYAADDRDLFYRGKRVAASDGPSAQTLRYTGGDWKGREDFNYVRDARAVYFKGAKVPGASPMTFTLFVPDDGSQDLVYGVEGATRQIYFQGQPFPSTIDGIDARNLHVLLADRGHANHDLFMNTHGIFFFDTGKGRPRRACAFTNAGLDLRPVDGMRSVFTDGRRLYFVSARQDRSGQNGRTLASQSTVLARSIPGVELGQLQRGDTVKDKDGQDIGTLWSVPGQALFVPRFTQGNSYRDSLYGVPDVNRLTSAARASNGDFGDLERAGLQTLDAEQVCVATTNYSRVWW